MGKNQKAVKVLQRLFDAGYGTEKEIVNMTMDEMLALPGVNVADLCIISELQKSIKTNKVISYLSGKTINILSNISYQLFLFRIIVITNIY